MKFVAAAAIACLSVASVGAEDADVLRLEVRPLEYIDKQIGLGFNVVYMGRSGDWFRFDFFFDFEHDGVLRQWGMV